MAQQSIEWGASMRLASLMGRQRMGSLVVLAASAGAWMVLAWLAFDMHHPLARLTMPGTSHWGVASTLAIGAMWALMMAAMMLPAALPTVLTFVDLSVRGSQFARAASFVAGYLLVWVAFSGAATAAQWRLQAAGWVGPMIVSTSAWLSGLLLAVAGLYQFTPLKRACLSTCRSPLTFLLGRWRAGVRGAFVMGAQHGLYCLGCCWALMALLFVGGVMNLAWIAALAVAVAIEKLAPRGEWIGMALGLLLLGAGVVRLLAMVA